MIRPYSSKKTVLNSNKGFTLIELLVVIAIIGLLSSVVLATLQSSRAKGRDAKRLGDMRQIRNALETYRTTNGSYPSSGTAWRGLCGNWDGNDTLTNTGANGYIPNLAPKFIPVLPVDPKPNDGAGQCYLYNSDGTDYMFLVYFTVETGTIPTLVRPNYPAELDYAIYSDGARTW